MLTLANFKRHCVVFDCRIIWAPYVFFKKISWTTFAEVAMSFNHASESPLS